MPLYDFGCEHGHRFERQCRIAERNEPVPCEVANCGSPATLIIAHSNPGGWFDHGIAANRDAAREGRVNFEDPGARVITRGLRKGRSWRK